MHKLIVKQKFCASSWLIIEINILRCTVSKTSKYFHKGPGFGEHGWAFLSLGLLIGGIFIRSFRDMPNAL